MSQEIRIDKDRIALGVQQPWAELIMRGIKTIEIRRTNTQKRDRIWIYASRKFSNLPEAEVMRESHQLVRNELVYGQLIGSVVLRDSRRATEADADDACLPGKVLEGFYAWELADPIPLKIPVDVKFLPYGVWFYPFKRKQKSS